MQATIAPGTVRVPGKNPIMKQVRIGLIAAGAAAGVHGITRTIVRRRSGFHSYKRRFQDWLEPRLETLASSLGTTSEAMQEFGKEVQAVAKMAMCLTRVSNRVPADKRDLLEIAVDKRILKMKKKIHRMLDITENAQATALHDFYRELRGWLVPDEQYTETKTSLK